MLYRALGTFQKTSMVTTVVRYYMRFRDEQFKTLDGVIYYSCKYSEVGVIQ